jgi:RNase P subunit RPR2
MVTVVGRDESKVKRVTCRGCASVLEYKQSEVQSRHGRDISGCADGEDYVICPDCGGRAVIRAW